MNITDALRTLGLSIPVSHEDIRKAFRVKAKLFHPDKEIDPGKKQESSNKFILARKAHDYLLSLSPEHINTYRNRPQPQPVREPVVKRYRTPRAQVVVVESPIVKELDNVGRLFHLINKKGQSLPIWKAIMNFSFSPSEWLGRLYEVLIEKKYPAEKRLEGLAYSVYQFIKIFTGSIFLIAGFMGISILGLILLVVVFPPVMVFLIVYFAYRNLIDFFEKLWQKDGKSGLLTLRLKYLMLRTLPVVVMMLAAQAWVLLQRDGSEYMQTMSWILCVPVILLALSITYEWMQYFSMKQNR